MARRCRRWSSEPSCARIFHQSSQFFSFCSSSLHLLSSSRFLSLAAFFSSFTLSSKDELWRRQEQSLAH